MARAKTTKKLLVQLGDGGSPETFSANCSINTTKEFTITASPLEFNIPDCDDEDAPSWIARVIDTLSAGFTGAGTLDTPSFEAWREWMLSGEERNLRVRLDVPGADGGGYFEGPYVPTTLGLSKEGKGLVQINVEVQSAGEVVWVDAS